MVRRHGCFLVLERNEGTTHRSHLSSPGDIVSSGAFFDEFGRLHYVRSLLAYSARFEIRVREGCEASGIEPVIV